MSEWEIEPQLPAVRKPKPNTFVPALPEPKPLTYQAAQPHELMPLPTVQEVVTYTATPVERAKAFHITSVPVALVFAFTAFLVAVLVFGNPWLSAPALITLFVVFVVAWLIMLGLDALRSPEGAAILRELGIMRLLNKEQDFRHEYTRHANGMPPKRKGRK